MKSIGQPITNMVQAWWDTFNYSAGAKHYTTYPIKHVDPALQLAILFGAILAFYAWVYVQYVAPEDRTWHPEHGIGFVEASPDLGGAVPAELDSVELPGTGQEAKIGDGEIKVEQTIAEEVSDTESDTAPQLLRRSVRVGDQNRKSTGKVFSR